MYKHIEIDVMRNGYELSIGNDIDLVFSSQEDMFADMRRYFEDPVAYEDSYRVKKNSKYFDKELSNRYTGESPYPVDTVGGSLYQQTPSTFMYSTASPTSGTVGVSGYPTQEVSTAPANRVVQEGGLRGFANRLMGSSRIEG